MVGGGGGMRGVDFEVDGWSVGGLGFDVADEEG